MGILGTARALICLGARCAFVGIAEQLALYASKLARNETSFTDTYTKIPDLSTSTFTCN